MGMGKTLSTLALVMQTLDEARQFAIRGTDDERKPRSSATLIISPLTSKSIPVVDVVVVSDSVFSDP